MAFCFVGSAWSTLGNTKSEPGAVATGSNEVQRPTPNVQNQNEFTSGLALILRGEDLASIAAPSTHDFGHWTLDFGLRSTRSLPLPVLNLSTHPIAPIADFVRQTYIDFSTLNACRYKTVAL